MKDNNTLSDYYKNFFIKHNVKYVDNIKDIENLDNVLFVTSCCKTKNTTEKDIPKNFYIGKRNLKFYEICEKLNLNYGIQSDKYGIHFSDEKLEYYDIHPSQLTEEDKKKLGKIIEEKCKRRNIKNIIFCNSSPLQSRPYIEMLTYSGVNFYFLSNLKILEEAKNE